VSDAGAQERDLSERVRELGLKLAHGREKLATLATDVADLELFLADVFDERARTSVDRAAGLRDIAAEARRYAAVERARAADYAAPAPEA
jgi:hypothetical protein